jgi:outer membrane protein, heavy metal efflux system
MAPLDHPLAFRPTRPTPGAAWRHGLLTVALAVAVLPPPARAAIEASAGVTRDTTTLALRLDDALEMARHGSWDLRAADRDLAIAVAGVRTAKEFPNPSFSILTGKVHVDGMGDGTELGNDFWSRSYDTVAQLGQLFELDGKRGDRRRAATAGADAARARLADTRRTIEEAVVRAYVGAALADANARIARESAGYLRDEARLAEVRWKAGDLSRSDLDQIEIAASRLDLDARTAETAAITQRVALEVLLGRPEPGGHLVVADTLDTLVDRVGGPAPVATGGVRPDLAAARAELRRADFSWRLERARRVSDPTLVFQAEHEPPDRPNTIGFGIAFPLPLWNRNAGAIQAAEAERENATLEVARLEASVNADLAMRSAARDEATTRWRRYRDELRPRSDEIRRSVSLAYQKGGASLIDLLEAQRNDNDVRLATMQAASDAVIAAAELRSAATTFASEDTRP